MEKIMQTDFVLSNNDRSQESICFQFRVNYSFYPVDRLKVNNPVDNRCIVFIVWYRYPYVVSMLF